jgi:hypothetical protein
MVHRLLKHLKTVDCKSGLMTPSGAGLRRVAT